MKSKKLWQISLSVFAITSISCGVYFYQQRTKLHKYSHQATELLKLQDQKLFTLVEAYKIKYSFVKSLLPAKGTKKTEPSQDLIKSIEKQLTLLENLKITNQAEFDSFEFNNNVLGQILASEINKFNHKEKSLFNNLALIRDLERFDRHIDVVRSNYSHWTFQYYTLKENIEKNMFSKNGLNSVMYFKIDHMIFSKKGLTEVPRSAAL
jgi:hypothetical protein